MTAQMKPEPTSSPSDDPSMEDILASIRRILTEEQTPEPPAAAANSGPQPVANEAVLVLDTSMMVADAQEAGTPPAHVADARASSAPPAHVADAQEAGAPLAHVADAPEAGAPPAHDASPAEPVASVLVAPEAAAAAASSVGSLIRTLAAERTLQVASNGPTIEDVVRAELRPLLREWLNANLPPLVERLVRAEIERVVGRVVP
jgi:hypothetical protein